MNELHLFAGAGGGILGGILLGHTCVCAVEIEPYCRKVLLQRQRDGMLPKFPIWDDVCTFDGKPWRGKVDIVCGGFPCQDISAAGKGAGIDGERSGLWKEFARIIGEVRPRYVLVENSPMLSIRGLGTVLGDLATLGYDADWCVLGAVDAGAPHKRDRMWIVAHSNSDGLAKPEIRGSIVKTALDEQARQDNAQHITGASSISTSRSDVADTESREDIGRERRDVDETPCRRQGCDTSFNACREDVPNSLRVRGETGIADKEGREEGNTTESINNNLASRITWWDRDPADVANAESWRTGTLRDESEEEGSRNGDELLGKCSGLQGALLSDSRNDGNEQRVWELREVEQTSRDRGDNGRGASLDEIGERWTAKPFMGRVAHGVANRVDRLKAIGNGQVPAVVALAWETLVG